MALPLEQFCRERLEEAEKEGLRRALRAWEIKDSRTVSLDGRALINFASNDYLGFSTHPEIRKASADSSGATASRLLTGNHAAYRELEADLAAFKQLPAALVFSSGYAAAIGTIPALVGESDFIVMDKLAHACLVDGARLSGATLRVFPHNNLKRCEELVKKCRASDPKANILIVTESVFSMDGDLAPLSDLVEIKKRHDAWLMVDEAHATGVFGKNGRGGAEHFGVEKEIDVTMGTLSKALACVGGFIAGSNVLKDLLIQRARSMLFSTGLPTGVCRAAQKAIRVMQKEPEHRAKLWENVRAFGKHESPIIPIVIGDERACLEAAEKLLSEGIYVPAIRYPTVAKGKARLRISLSAAHTKDDMQVLMGIIPLFR